MSAIGDRSGWNLDRSCNLSAGERFRRRRSKLLHALGLSQDLLPELTSYPAKGLGPLVPTDPLIYRFYEIMQVYGMPMKEVIHEKFGDGIMSAIDFTLDIEKEEDPKAIE